ncbi:MAG TPA: hypothetical protein VGJ04_10410 [Pirellulales bacterium]|jgi:hypothetical protein
MTKLLLVIGEIGIVLAIIAIVAKHALSQRKLDHIIEQIAWFVGLAVITVLVLLACEHFTGSDYIASTLERFLHWLHS